MWRAFVNVLMNFRIAKNEGNFLTGLKPVGFSRRTVLCGTVAYPGMFFVGGSTNSVEDRGQRERGSGGGSPLVRGSGGSCNLVKKFHFI